MEPFTKIEKDLKAVREGLQAIGFKENEVFELFDRDNTELEEDVGAEQIEQIQEFSDVGLPVLLFILYIGHGVVKQNLVHCVDKDGDDSYNLEGFVQACALMPNIFTVSVLDCCRRDKGGVQPVFSRNSMDMIAVYRSEVTELACTCDPWQVPSLSEAFFDHLESKRKKRKDRQVCILPDDLISFRTAIALEPLVIGWNQGSNLETEQPSSSNKFLERRDQVKQLKQYTEFDEERKGDEEQVESEEGDEFERLEDVIKRRLYGVGARKRKLRIVNSKRLANEEIDEALQVCGDEQDASGNMEKKKKLESSLRPFQSPFLQDDLAVIQEDTQE